MKFNYTFSNIISMVFILATTLELNSQSKWESSIQKMLPQVLKTHQEFVSLPNVASNYKDMHKNVDWVSDKFEKLGFNIQTLESTTLPVFFAEKSYDGNEKSILFYFHLDGQAVNPENWDQDDPFIPVLKSQNDKGGWDIIDWSNLDDNIDPEWRVFGRASADDKGPIMMMLTALEILEKENKKLPYNVKIILDLQEEASSHGFLSTLGKYKEKYSADYMIIMDGPAHPSNRPTLTFGCRGISTFNLTVYGAKLPQHSGHYGNYSPNPIFSMSHLLTTMKDESGKVIIDGYYDGINLNRETKDILSQVPDNEEEIQKKLGISKPDQIGKGYQEALQYPSLNIRHIETSWKGPGLKTVIPEYVTAHFDVRLVAETDGQKQLDKIKNHIKDQDFLLLDRDPTDEERFAHPKIAKFVGNPGVNAFRTELNSEIGIKLRKELSTHFGEDPVSIRSMGGTVPIIPAVNTLQIPAIIVPMVNMDNNQHNPNENLRIGNMIQGIKMCLVILSMEI